MRTHFSNHVCRMQHERLHVKHQGHEAMHAEMVMILVATLVVAQIVLVQWKLRHHRSYNVSVRARARVTSGCLTLVVLSWSRWSRCGWFLFTSPSNSTGGGSCPCGVSSLSSPAMSSSEPRVSRSPAGRQGRRQSPKLLWQEKKKYYHNTILRFPSRGILCSYNFASSSLSR